MDLPNFENEQLLPDAEAFPAMSLGATANAGRVHSSSETDQRHESSSSAYAPLQRKKRLRNPKQLPVDARQELRNADLADWKEQYATNMTEAVASQALRRNTRISKRNAAYWVIGMGIGGIGVGMGAHKKKSPLEIFSGPAFIDTLRGTPANIGRKRTRANDSDDDIDSEGRHVRAKDGDNRLFGLSNDDVFQGDDTAMVLAGDVSSTRAAFCD